jgi:hypothetical protein
VVALLAATLVFGIALLVGWATAGTREDLSRAHPLPAAKPPPRLVLLGSAAPLPPAPAAHRSVRKKAPEVPRLIVGSG